MNYTFCQHLTCLDINIGKNASYHKRIEAVEEALYIVWKFVDVERWQIVSYTSVQLTGTA